MRPGPLGWAVKLFSSRDWLRTGILYLGPASAREQRSGGLVQPVWKGIGVGERRGSREALRGGLGAEHQLASSPICASASHLPSHLPCCPLYMAPHGVPAFIAWGPPASVPSIHSLWGAVIESPWTGTPLCSKPALMREM